MVLKKIENLGPEPVEDAELQAYLHLTDDVVDRPRLSNVLRAARAAVESFTGKVLSPQRFHMSVNMGFALDHSTASYLTGPRYPGNRGVILPKVPFVAIHREPYVERGGKSINLRYRLVEGGRAARLYVDDLNTCDLSRFDNIQLVFDAGYEVDALPRDLHHAIIMLAADFYDGYSTVMQQGVAGHQFPGRVLDILKPYQSLRLL